MSYLQMFDPISFLLCNWSQKKTPQTPTLWKDSIRSLAAWELIAISDDWHFLIHYLSKEIYFSKDLSRVSFIGSLHSLGYYQASWKCSIWTIIQVSAIWATKQKRSALFALAELIFFLSQVRQPGIFSLNEIGLFLSKQNIACCAHTW